MQEPEKAVIIVGAGSIGLLMGSFLAQQYRVVFLVKREEQARSLREKGLIRMAADGFQQHVRVEATTSLQQLPPAFIWIIAVKNPSLYPLLKQLGPHVQEQAALFIQNGIGHLEVIDQIPFAHIAFASVEHGAFRKKDHIVAHNGMGPITFAAVKGEKRYFQFLKAISSNDFPIEEASQVGPLLLRKALLNCMINPLTAILNIPNGELVTNPYAAQLQQQLHKEIQQVFPELNDSLTFSDVQQLCRKTAANHSSMLADRLSGRTMEIDTIVSAVIRVASKRHCKMPMLQTLEMLLWALNEKGGQS